MLKTTTCIYCGCGCQVNLHVKKGRVNAVTPNKTGSGEGKLCIKGWNSHEFIHHPDRLKDPLIKENGKFRTASWKEALSLIVKKFTELKEVYGRNSIGFLSSGKVTNEESYLLQKFARAVIGNNNIDHCARLCHSATVVGLEEAFGCSAMTNSQEDIEEADCIFVIGSNVLELYPIYGRRILKAIKKGAKLIVADPRKISLTQHASIHLQQRPGSDIALINAMINCIITEELQNTAFINAKTIGYQQLFQTIKRYTPESVKHITGIIPSQIHEAAKMYANAEKAAIIYAMGITQRTTGVDAVKSLANLALLTGNIGKPGTGVNALRGQNNVQGTCDMGALPGLLPGYRALSNQDNLNLLGDKWGVELSSEKGMISLEMFEECGERIKSLFVMGENPMMSDPNQNHIRTQLAKLSFLVVLDIFMSETAQMADVVLPAASFAEKNGTFTATDRRIQLVNKAIDPVGQALPDWKIIQMLSQLMGYPMNYNDPSEIMKEIMQLTPIYGGVSYLRLKKEDLRWPCPSSDHPGTRILHKDGIMNGRGKFHSVDYTPPVETCDSMYPYVLTTGCVQYHWNTGTMTRRSPTLNKLMSEPYVEIHPREAELLMIMDGDPVKVRSRRGEITLKAKITDKILRKLVFIPYHFSEAAANILTNNKLDPSSKTPHFKICAVSIMK